MDFAKTRVDPERWNGGTWVRYDAETEVLIASYRNARHRLALRRRVAQLLELHPGANAEDEDFQASIFYPAELETLVEGVLLGWRGMKNDGAELAFSREMALEVLRGDPAFAAWVLEQSHQLRHFRAQAEDAAGKA